MTKRTRLESGKNIFLNHMVYPMSQEEFEVGVWGGREVTNRKLPTFCLIVNFFLIGTGETIKPHNRY